MFELRYISEYSSSCKGTWTLPAPGVSMKRYFFYWQFEYLRSQIYPSLSMKMIVIFIRIIIGLYFDEDIFHYLQK